MNDPVALDPELELVPSSDIDLAVELRMEFLEAMGVDLSGEVRWTLREANRLHLQEGTRDGSVLVLLAKWNGSLAGCAMLQELRTIPNPTIPSGRYGMLLNVHVREGFRRRGIGESLVREVVRHARSRGLDRLDLKATEMGEPLYRRLGWLDVKGGWPLELELKPLPR